MARTMSRRAAEKKRQRLADSGGEIPQPAAKRPKAKQYQPPGEKRLRKFREAPPKPFDDVYERALSQRFYVLGRQRVGWGDDPEEIVELTGSTGNIYHVTIARQPSCTCPHAVKGNQCKHVLFVSFWRSGCRETRGLIN